MNDPDAYDGPKAPTIILAEPTVSGAIQLGAGQELMIRNESGRHLWLVWSDRLDDATRECGRLVVGQDPGPLGITPDEAEWRRQATQ